MIRFWTWSPVAVAIFFAVLTPTYYRPMFENFLGLVMLAMATILTTLSIFMGWAGTHYLGKLEGARAVLLTVPALVFTAPILWILILGPAALILMHPRT